MTPDQIRQLVEEDHPELVAQPRGSPDGWAFFLKSVRRGSNPTRIARAVQSRPGAPVRFKPAISARLAGEKRLEFPITGGAAQVRELLNRELALWRRHFEAPPDFSPHRPGSGAPVSDGAPAPAAEQSVGGAHDTSDLVYDLGQWRVDPNRALIHLWEVENATGDIVFRYVGKARNGAARPLQDYRRNVRNLLQGRPYRKGKPDAYRAIHRRLADAMGAGETVRLRFIRDIEPHEDIDEVERRYQRHYGC